MFKDLKIWEFTYLVQSCLFYNVFGYEEKSLLNCSLLTEAPLENTIIILIRSENIPCCEEFPAKLKRNYVFVQPHTT